MRWTSTKPTGDSPAAARDTLRRRHRELLEAHPLGALSREAWDQPEARRLRDRIEGRTVVLHAPTAAPAEVPNAVC